MNGCPRSSHAPCSTALSGTGVKLAVPPCRGPTLATCVCAFLEPAAAASTSTVSSSTNFFRALRDGELRGTTRPLHAGRTTIVVQTELRDADDKLVALVTQTQAVLTR